LARVSGYFDRVVGPQAVDPPITTANFIARWDGGQWTPLSSGGQVGMNNSVYDLSTFAGELIASGQFTMRERHRRHSRIKPSGTFAPIGSKKVVGHVARRAT